MAVILQKSLCLWFDALTISFYFLKQPCKKMKVEVASGPVLMPLSAPLAPPPAGGAACPPPWQLFHRERHLSHCALSSRKLQLKLEVTALSDL